MGLALYVALEKEVPGVDASSVCGKALAKAQARLDGIARQHGLTPLEDFLSVAPEDVAALLGDEGEAPEGLGLPAEQWFDPADGLRTVRGLLTHGGDRPAGVRDDLEATERVLLAARQHGVRFHLALDF
jgi:hypothetical protein